MSLGLQLTFCPENIPVAVSVFQASGEVPVLQEQRFEGGQCFVYKVNFLDGTSWAVRIPVQVRAGFRDGIVHTFEAEKDVLQELNRAGFRWAPKYHGSDLTFDNPIGCPFIALSWIDGEPLSWSSTYPPRPVRDKVLAQMAEIQMSLIDCTKDYTKGPSSAYFLRRIENKIIRIRKGILPEINEEDCSKQKALLQEVIHHQLENAPFAVDHGDLSNLNIIVNSEYDITGIIDWGFAVKVPAEQACRMPRFLQLKEPILPPSPTLQDDRKAYRASIVSRFSEVACCMLLVQSPEDFDFRHFYLESIISKGMHSQLARLGWKLPTTADMDSSPMERDIGNADTKVEMKKEIVIKEEEKEEEEKEEEEKEEEEKEEEEKEEEEKEEEEKEEEEKEEEEKEEEEKEEEEKEEEEKEEEEKEEEEKEEEEKEERSQF